jgi:two-component system, NtrC family, sensor kinase
MLVMKGARFKRSPVHPSFLPPNALSEIQYRSVVDNSPYGIYRVTYEGRFIAVNPALCAMLGYTAEELLSANIGMLYARPEQRAQLVAEYDERPHGKPIEIPWRRKDGTVITARLWFYADRDADGRVLVYDGYVEDVTPLRAAERALQQAEKLAAVGQLISGVAHELNNPLSAILLFTDDLLSVERPEDEREALGIIAQQARRSRAIVRDLLTFVRPGELVRLPVAPDGFFDQVGRTLQPQVAELNVTLHVDVADGDLVHIDHAAIEQVITNLVMNAAQAVAGAGRPGIVWVRGRAQSNEFVIEVTDDGPGIDPAILSRIFEPFFTTKPLGQGTGLGLSVTMGIVHQHGGSIVAGNRGESEGSGARFVVRLPLTSRANSAANAVTFDRSFLTV